MRPKERLRTVAEARAGPEDMWLRRQWRLVRVRREVQDGIPLAAIQESRPGLVPLLREDA